MMALTLEAEQRLTDVGAVAFYEKDAADWLATVRATKAFIKGQFPADAPIRRDDVAKALISVLEVHEEFKDYRSEKTLRAKYWIRDFADLLVDRTWDNLDNGGQDGQN
jgi:hypothetical protein